MCRAVIQDFLNLKLLLALYHDDRRPLYTSTIIIDTAQHTDMERSVDTVVRRYVQSVVDWTSFGKDLERSQPAW